jgi:hypothetical protein
VRPAQWNQGLSPAQQFVQLRGSRIAGGYGKIHCGRFTWNYVVRPTPLSRDYQLRLEYQRDYPEIYVQAPDVVSLAGGRPLPHVYSEKPVRLCLHLPKTREWHRGLSIAATLVPWSYLWALYFEDWLATDDWKGGGMHPGKEAPIHGRQ